jgi:hypothetical protein
MASSARRRRRRATALRLAGALTLAALAVPALASALDGEGEPTRDSYREAVEPLCHANARASERILKHARAEVKADRLAVAGRRFARASRALARTYRQLAAVPRPPADQARLSHWLARIRREVRLFALAGRDLRHGRKGRAAAIVVKLNHNARTANNLVVPLRFRYCRFEPSKFT